MGLLDDLKSIAMELGERYPVKLIVLFGSQAEGRATKLSDVDIAILAEGDVEDIGDEIRRRLRREVDIVDLRTAPIVLKYLIMRDGILLYGDRRDFHELRSLAIREYIDFKRILKPHTERAMKYLGVTNG